MTCTSASRNEHDRARRRDDPEYAEQNREYQREYRRRNKKRLREKARIAAQSPHRRAKAKEYRERPEVKARHRIHQRRFDQREDTRWRRAWKSANHPHALHVTGARHRPCVDCGLVLPPACMEFDHVRGEKAFGLNSRAVTENGMTIARLDTEIAKCDIRCPSCHKLRHYRARPWSGPHGVLPPPDVHASI